MIPAALNKVVHRSSSFIFWPLFTIAKVLCWEHVEEEREKERPTSCQNDERWWFAALNQVKVLKMLAGFSSHDSYCSLNIVLARCFHYEPISISATVGEVNRTTGRRRRRIITLSFFIHLCYRSVSLYLRSSFGSWPLFEEFWFVN